MRPHHRRHARQAGIPPPDDARRSDVLMRSTPPAARKATRSRRHPGGAAAGARDPEFRIAASRARRSGSGRAYRVSDSRSPPPVVLPGSSIPDEELIDVAASGRLREPAVLEPGARMLKEQRADALVTNFTGSGERASCGQRAVVNLFPDFDETCGPRSSASRAVLRRIVHEDRSALDLITADYTFVKRALAKHYGIANIYGPALPPRHAAGGARHAAGPARQGRAADGDVAGGAHLAGDPRQVFPQTFLGVSPPDPAQVRRCRKARRPTATSGETLAPAARGARANPACAQCHRSFEPMGLRWRTSTL